MMWSLCSISVIEDISITTSVFQEVVIGWYALTVIGTATIPISRTGLAMAQMYMGLQRILCQPVEMWDWDLIAQLFCHRTKWKMSGVYRLTRFDESDMSRQEGT